MQTTIQFAEADGKLRVVSSDVNAQDGSALLQLQYAPAATVWRVNLGWRRRKEESIHGFNIDTVSGLWSKDEQAPQDQNDDATKSDKHVERISPYVEDRRNVMIIRPAAVVNDQLISSLQYALKRGIEAEFQIEESELMVEPLPTRSERNAILFYESAEGGAGVLTRLVSDSNALSRIAKRAIEICHYELEADGELRNTSEECEAGCYRCLLSYYNQMDHQDIDRQLPELLELLKGLANASVQSGNQGKTHSQQTDHLETMAGSTLEKAFIEHLKKYHHHLPDDAQVVIDQFNTRPDFVYKAHSCVVYIDGPHHENPNQIKIDRELTKQLEAAGLTVVRFSKEQSSWPEKLAQYPDIFGAPSA